MKKKFFYGWLIVVLGVLLAGISSGAINGLAVFMPSMKTFFNCSQTDVSLMLMFMSIGSVLGSLFFGKALGKANLRIFIPIAGVIEGLAILLMGFAGSLTFIYILSFVAGIFTVVVSSLTVPILINNWFNAKRGFALAITVTGISLGNVIFAPLFTQLLTHNSLSFSFIIFGIIIILVSIAAVFIIRTKPEEKGFKAYGLNEGDPQVNENEKEVSSSSDTGLTLLKAMATPAYWLIVVLVVAMSFVSTSTGMQTASFITEAKMSPNMISLFLMASGITSIIGKIILGKLFDTQGLLKACLIAAIMGLLSCISMVFLTSVPMLSILYVLFQGPGTMFVFLSLPLFVTKLFGSKNFSSIYSSFYVILAVANIATSVVSGLIIDGSGFPMMYIVCTVLIIISAIAFTVALKTKKRFA